MIAVAAVQSSAKQTVVAAAAAAAAAAAVDPAAQKIDWGLRRKMIAVVAGS